MDELYAEPSCLDHVPRLTGDELGAVQQAVFLQLQLDESGGHAGGVDGGVDRPQHIGQRPDVVLVAVGDENAPDLVLVLDQVGDVRDNHVDAVHVVVGEAHAHVHYNDVAAVFVDRQVFSDLVQAAQRNDFQFFCHDNSFSYLGWFDVSRPKKPYAIRRRTASPRPCLAGLDARSLRLSDGICRR